jgi:hypothetical protein
VPSPLRRLFGPPLLANQAADEQVGRTFKRRYALLTIALWLPLLWAFTNLRNLYPFAAATMMMEGGRLASPGVYYVLKGETVGGQRIDLPPIRLTDALTGRHWGLVIATVDNKSFTIRWPHPENQALAARAGGVDRLPDAARLPDLLRAWGNLHNNDLPAGSPQQLRAVLLDAYRWQGEGYADYDAHVQTWRLLL